MEHALVYKDSEATTDVKPSMESPKLDETFKASPLVDELVNSVAAPVAIAVSEILHAKKGDNSASNTDQGSVVSDSINILISEAASISVSVALSEVSESTTASLEASTSESEVVEEPAVYLTESESQASTSEEMIFEGVPENINSWNRLSETPRVSEFLLSTFKTVTEVASLFSNYERYSETASSESHSMVVATSEVSIEKLAVPILRDTEGGLYDATTIRNIVEMIDSITTDVSYMRSSRQDLVNTPSSENTYNGS